MYQELDNDLLTKANELAQQGKVEAALLNYDEILSHKDQFYSHAVIQKVQLLEHNGKYEEAVAVCDSAIQFETYYKYFELKGDLLKNGLDKTYEAETLYKQALAALKQLLSEKENATNVFLYIEKGNLLKKLNQHLEAIDVLQTAEQFTTNVEELGEVYFSKGLSYEAWASLIDDMELYEKALAAFEKARRHGKTATFYIENLTSYIRMHKALQQIEKKIAEHPEIAKNYFDKAQILWEMPDGLKQYHEIVHLLDMAEALSKVNKEKGEICYVKYVYYKKKKELDAGHSFFDDKDTLSKKIDLLKKAFNFYKQCGKKDNVVYDTAYIAKLLANYFAQLGDESYNLYYYKLALDHFIFAREHSLDPYYGNIFKDSEVGIREMKEKLEGSEYSEDDRSVRTVEGILYQSVEEANEARKELATVERIRGSVNVTDYDSLMNALGAVQQLTLDTNAGKKLLKEIQEKIQELDRKRGQQANVLPQLRGLEDEESDDSIEFDWSDSMEYDAIDENQTNEEFAETGQTSIFDNLEDTAVHTNQSVNRSNVNDSDDEYERFVIDENDPRVQDDLIAIAQILQGDEYKRNETVAIRCLNQLHMVKFNTPIGAQFIHILERIIADFDLRARTVNEIIYGSRYEAQETIEQMLDGHMCDSEAELREVLRFHSVVESAKRNSIDNITLLNTVIPELNRYKFNKEILKPFLISLLDDKGKRELLSQLYTQQERAEMKMSTQIILWVLLFTISVVFISFFTYIGLILVAFAYPFYLFVRRGQEYMWKFFTNNGTIPISKYEEYFARPTLRYKKY
jgi:tetratricopeptide (TPR) repeat protein